MLGMYHHLCTSEMLDMILHTCMHAYGHSPDSPERRLLSLEHVDHDNCALRVCELGMVMLGRDVVRVRK